MAYKAASEDPYIHVRACGDSVEINGVPSCHLGDSATGTGKPMSHGVFAGWKWDGERLKVVNDRFGFYPLYYYVGQNECAISASIPNLLALGAPRELDYAALAVFFHLGFFLAEDTPFLAIRALPPDAEFEWAKGILSVSGRLALPTPQQLDQSQALEAYIALFGESIRKRLPADKEFAVLLSGGRDSRHILLELLRINARPSFCLTLGLEGPHALSDVAIAAELAEATNVPHVILPARHADFKQELEKNVITNFCADEHGWFMPAGRYFEENSAVVFDGIAGDVLSAGLLLTKHRLDLMEGRRLHDLALDFIGKSSIDAVIHRQMVRLVTREVAVDRIVTELERHVDAPNPVSSFVFWNRTRREIALAPYRILRRIRSVVCPYLDHALYDLLAGLPGHMFVDHSFHTQAINRAFPKHAHIPYAVHHASAGGDPWRYRRFVTDVAWYAMRHNSSLLSKVSLFLRLFRCLFDPRYVDSIRWLGPTALYLLQLGSWEKQPLADSPLEKKFCGSMPGNESAV